MSLGSKLRKIRNDKNLSMEELKNILNVKYDLNISKSMISRWENNKSEPLNTYLAAYAKEFNLDMNDLLDIEQSDSDRNKSFITIPVLGEVPAGVPIEAIEDITGTEDLSLKDFDINKDYIGIRVIGDSMYPKYIEGDTIIVEIKPTFESGQDGIAYVNGYNATLKTLYHNSDGSITLKPINPEYPPKTYGRKKDDPPVTILGVVKEIRRKV